MKTKLPYTGGRYTGTGRLHPHHRVLRKARRESTGASRKGNCPSHVPPGKSGMYQERVPVLRGPDSRYRTGVPSYSVGTRTLLTVPTGSTDCHLSLLTRARPSPESDRSGTVVRGSWVAMMGMDRTDFWTTGTSRHG